MSDCTRRTVLRFIVEKQQRDIADLKQQVSNLTDTRCLAPMARCISTVVSKLVNRLMYRRMEMREVPLHILLGKIKLRVVGYGTSEF